MARQKQEELDGLFVAKLIPSVFPASLGPSVIETKSLYEKSKRLNHGLLLLEDKTPSAPFRVKEAINRAELRYDATRLRLQRYCTKDLAASSRL